MIELNHLRKLQESASKSAKENSGNLEIHFEDGSVLNRKLISSSVNADDYGVHGYITVFESDRHSPEVFDMAKITRIV